MIHLDSSAIKAVDYNASTGTLDIWFPDDGPYTFVGVPTSVYQGLIRADSPGAYYREYIRGNYQAS